MRRNKNEGRIEKKMSEGGSKSEERAKREMGEGVSFRKMQKGKWERSESE